MALKEFNQEIIGAGSHYIPKLWLLPNRVAKLVSVRPHSGNKFIEIISLDPDMMHCAPSLRLRRLLVYLNERVP